MSFWYLCHRHQLNAINGFIDWRKPIILTELDAQAATYIGLDNYAGGTDKNMSAPNSIHIPSIGQRTTSVQGLGEGNSKRVQNVRIAENFSALEQMSLITYIRSHAEAYQ